MNKVKDDIFVEINCPVCENKYFDTILKFTPNQFLNEERKKYYNLNALNIDYNTNFFIKKCKKCGFTLVNPRLRDKFYKIAYNEAKVGQYEFKGWIFKDRNLGNLFNLYNKYREIFPLLNALQFFRKYFEKPKNEGYDQLKLLDYGCGFGHILDLCKVFGIDGTGVEIDSFRLNYCKRRGLNVMLPEELTSTGKFHIIISTSVIEHVNDLDKYFEYVRSRLLKNGIFAFNGLTPKIITIEKKKQQFNLVLPLEHINYFTRETLLILAKKHGLEEASGAYSIFDPKNLLSFTYPLLRRFVFKGFYPTGNFETILIKK